VDASREIVRKKNVHRDLTQLTQYPKQFVVFVFFCLFVRVIWDFFNNENLKISRHFSFVNGRVSVTFIFPDLFKINFGCGIF
jgi:hypothetical protein